MTKDHPPSISRVAIREQHPARGGGGRDGGELLDKSDGMLVVSLRGVNRRF